MKLINLLINRFTLLLVPLLPGHLRAILFSQLHESKRLHVFYPHIFHVCLLQPIKVVGEVAKLFVLWIIIEREDGHSVVDIECKA